MAAPSITTSTGVYSYSAGKETSHEGVYDLDNSNPRITTKTEGNYKRRWHKYGEAFFRSIGLQSFNNFTPWRGYKESPKIAVEQNRWKVLIRSLLHIPPLAGCVALLILSGITTIVQPNSAFSILQFAAKLHEIFMQASIAVILLSHVRYEFTQNGHVPFGSLFAAAQISSIGFIWSPEMIGTMKSKGMAWSRKLALVLHVLFAIMLAAAVGPSSAILMIPRPIFPRFGQCTVTLPTTVDTLYPPRLSLETPGRSDFAAVSNLFVNIDSQDPRSRFQSPDTIQTSLGVPIMDGLSTRTLNSYEWEIVISAPLQITADAMRACSDAAWGTYDSYMSTESKQPFVYSHYCQPMPIIDMDSSSPLKIQVNYGPSNEGIYADLNITLGGFNDSYNGTNGSHIIWVAPPKYSNFSSSIVAVVAPDLKDVGTGVAWYWTCSIDGGWLPAVVNTTEYFQVQGYFTDKTSALLDEGSRGGGLDAAHIVSIDPAWAYNATANADLFKQRFESTTLKDLLDLAYIPTDEGQEPWNGTNDVSSPGISSMVIGGIISTAMSTALTVNAANITYVNTTYKRTDESIPRGIWMTNITSGPQTTFYNESTFRPGIISDEEARLLAEQDPSRSFVIDVFGKSLTGYAFESVPAILATAILCVYCLYVLISIIASIVVGISSNSWDSASEITALALNSTPPTHLGSISAGLKTLRVFQESVGVLVNEKDELELVFREADGGDEMFKAVERGKEY